MRTPFLTPELLCRSENYLFRPRLVGKPPRLARGPASATWRGSGRERGCRARTGQHVQRVRGRGPGGGPRSPGPTPRRAPCCPSHLCAHTQILGPVEASPQAAAASRGADTPAPQEIPASTSVSSQPRTPPRGPASGGGVVAVPRGAGRSGHSPEPRPWPGELAGLAASGQMRGNLPLGR